MEFWSLGLQHSSSNVLSPVRKKITRRGNLKQKFKSQARQKTSGFTCRCQLLHVTEGCTLTLLHFYSRNTYFFYSCRTLFSTCSGNFPVLPHQCQRLLFMICHPECLFQIGIFFSPASESSADPKPVLSTCPREKSFEYTTPGMPSVSNSGQEFL